MIARVKNAVSIIIYSVSLLSHYFVHIRSKWGFGSKNIILVNGVRTPLRTFCECDLKFVARVTSGQGLFSKFDFFYKKRPYKSLCGQDLNPVSADSLNSNFDNSTCVTVQSGKLNK